MARSCLVYCLLDSFEATRAVNRNDDDSGSSSLSSSPSNDFRFCLPRTAAVSQQHESAEVAHFHDQHEHHHSRRTRLILVAIVLAAWCCLRHHDTTALFGRRTERSLFHVLLLLFRVASVFAAAKEIIVQVLVQIFFVVWFLCGNSR
jgi:hypothetical protein